MNSNTRSFGKLIQSLMTAFVVVTLILVLAKNVSAEIIFSDNFSGSHPGAWTIGHDGGSGDYSWAWPSGYAHCYSNPAGGQYWYPDNLSVFMERRNVNLSEYSSAKLSFHYIVDTEPNYDFFTVNVRDQNGSWHQMFRESGVTSPLSWTHKEINLTQFAGQSGLYIQFRFDSDSSISGDPYNGVFLDNVVLSAEKRVSLTMTLANVSGSGYTPKDVEWRVDSGGILTGNPIIVTNLTPGTKWIESWQNGGTPWGKEKWFEGNHIVPETNSSATFTRHLPVSKGQTTIRLPDGTEVELGTPLVPNQQHTLRHRAYNPSDDVARTVRGLARISRTQNFGSADFTLTSSSQSLGAGGEVIFDFPFTPTATGTYYLTTSVETSLNSSWQNTDSEEWRMAFMIPTVTLTASLENLSTSPYTPNSVEWRVAGGSVLQGNPRSIGGLNPGEQLIESWQNGGTPWGKEKWYHGNYDMPPEPKTETFTRHLPVSKGQTTIRRPDGTEVELGTPLVPNQLHTLRHRAYNPSDDVAWSVRGLARISRTQNFGSAEFTLTSSSQSLGVGGEVVFDFPFTPTASGAYYLTTSVETSLNGSWVNTDSEDWLDGFSIIPPPPAQIITLTVPGSSPNTTRGSMQSTTVRVKNNTNGPATYWVGLSFRNEKYLDQGGQIGWYDIAPKQVHLPTPGSEVNVQFDFPIHENLEPGKFYAVAATWEDFNQDMYLMEGEIDSTKNYPIWNPAGNGLQSFTLGAYSLAPESPNAQIINMLSLFFPNALDLTSAYYDKENPWKPLLLINGSKSVTGLLTGGFIQDKFAGGEVSILIDLADYLKITPEGKDGRVTVWMDVGGHVGVGLAAGLPLEVGVIPYYFDNNDRPFVDQRVGTYEGLKGGFNLHIPFFSLYMLSPDNGNFRFVPNGTAKLGAELSIGYGSTTQGVVAVELPWDVIDNVLSSQYGPIQSAHVLSRMLEKLNDESIGHDWTFTSHDGAKLLADGVTEAAISIRQNPHTVEQDDSALFYRISLPQDVGRLTVQATPGPGASGGARMFLRRGSLPEHGDPIDSGADGLIHTIIVDNPESGDWFVRLSGNLDFHGLDLRYFTSTTPRILEIDIDSWAADPGGGQQQINVTSNISWTVESSKDWLTISPDAGDGDGSFTMTATANTTGSIRIATVTVEGDGLSRTVSVLQDPVSLEVNPSFWDAPPSGGSQFVEVTSNVSWTVSSSDTSWLTVSPNSGSNSGSFTMTATANNTGSALNATVTVSTDGLDRVIVVSQLPTPPPEVDPPSWTAPPCGGSQVVAVTSGGSWSVDSNQTWLTVDPPSGNGNENFTMTATANTSGSDRSATVTVSGVGFNLTIPVTQSPVVLSVTPMAWDAPPQGSSENFVISSNVSWTVSSDENWLTSVPGNGNDSGTLLISVGANTTNVTRTATVTVSGCGIDREIIITQPSILLAVDTGSWDAPYDGGNQMVSVTANVSWTANSDQDWLNVSPDSGSNDESFTMNATANNTGSTRNATITITDAGGSLTRTINVAQAAELVTLVSYDDWINRAEVPTQRRGRMDSAANDGVVNIVKYYQGIDPLDTRRLTGLHGMERPNPNQMRAWFLHSRVADDSVTGKIRWSMDMINWHDSGASDSGTTISLNMSDPETDPTFPPSAERERVWVEANIQGQVPKSLFLRLEVNQVVSKVSFEDWISRSETSFDRRGLMDSAANDGVANIVKYYQGFDPMDTSGNSGLRNMERPAANQMIAWFLRSRVADDSVIGTVRWSKDMVNWHASGASHAGTAVTLNMSHTQSDPTDQDREWVRVVTTIQGQIPASMFLRLEVNADNGTNAPTPRPIVNTGPPRWDMFWSNEFPKANVFLTGTVNPNGFETTVRFEYGTTPEYGNVVDGNFLSINGVSPPKNATTPLEVLAILDNLPGETTYYYRVTATNVHGTTYGSGRMFVTDRIAGHFTYASSEDATTITRYHGPGGNVEIPDVLGGLPVRTIGSYSFIGVSNPFSVTVSTSVTRLGLAAFAFSSGIQSVTIPGSVKEIGLAAFANCNNLSSITIMHGVERIEERAFESLPSLPSIHIPASVSFMGRSVFRVCDSLQSIMVDAANPHFSSLDGVLFNKNQTIMLGYPGGRAGHYTIPDTVTAIGEYAFSYSKNLTGVTIPNSVLRIDAGAFFGCRGLRSITLPESITEIPFYAFQYCTALERIVIPASVDVIQGFAFTYADNLKEMIFLGNAPHINYAFYGLNAGMTVYHLEGASGFTSPTWLGFPTAILDPVP